MTPTKEHERIDLERMRNVGDDLQHIREEVDHSVSDAQLRRLSGHLRRLLVEGHTLWAWRSLQMLPKQPIIIANKISAGDPAPGDTILAGEAYTGGMRMFFQRSCNGKSSLPQLDVQSDYSFPLHEYLQSAIIVHKGKRISRQQIVTYVANKKGGVHFDNIRRKDEEAYVVLDEMRDFFAADRSAIFHQFLSVGRSLVASEDMQRLGKRIAEEVSA